MTLGTFLWQRRMALGLTQKAVADAVNISPSYLHDIEQGRRTPHSPPLLMALAGALDVHPDILYFYAGRLAPDMGEMAVSADAILAAYAALRRTLLGGGAVAESEGWNYAAFSPGIAQIGYIQRFRSALARDVWVAEWRHLAMPPETSRCALTAQEAEAAIAQGVRCLDVGAIYGHI